MSRLSLLPSSVVALPRRKWRSPGPVPTPPSPQYWPASGAGGKEPRAPRSSQPRRRSDHNCGSRHLETVSCFPAQSSARPPLPKRMRHSKERRRAGGLCKQLQLSGATWGPRRTTRVVSRLSLESSFAAQAAPAALGAAILRLAPPSPPILFLLGQFFHCKPNTRQRPILASLFRTESHRSCSKKPELGPQVATVRQEER